MTKRYDQQLARIKQVFDAEEVPRVTDSTLHIYFDYLKEDLRCPCILTEIESMGYFKWEERFLFGYGSKQEYEQLRRQKGSSREKYELKTFDPVVEDEWDILVKGQRIPHRKRFTIPLSGLQAVDETSPNYRLPNDYTVWSVNWH